MGKAIVRIQGGKSSYMPLLYYYIIRTCLTVPKVSVSQQTETASPTLLKELHRVNRKQWQMFHSCTRRCKMLVCVGMTENVASSRCMYTTSAYFCHWNTCGWSESFVNLVKYGTWDLFMERCGQPQAMQKGITSTEIKQTNQPPTCSVNSILIWYNLHST